MSYAFRLLLLLLLPLLVLLALLLRGGRGGPELLNAATADARLDSGV